MVIYHEALFAYGISMETSVAMLVKLQRMDVEFVLAYEQNSAKVEGLIKSHTRDNLVELAKSIPLNQTALKTVRRTSVYSKGAALPFLSHSYTNRDIALYIVLACSEEAIQEIQDNINRLQSEANQLVRAQETTRKCLNSLSK